MSIRNCCRTTTHPARGDVYIAVNMGTFYVDMYSHGFDVDVNKNSLSG